MAENKLADMSTEFAVKILTLTDGIKGHYSLANQLERSGTSIGANVSEAQRGQSKADFNAKLNIALKEANETYYWLKLLLKTEYLTEKEFDSLSKNIDEIIAILVSICKKTNA